MIKIYNDITNLIESGISKEDFFKLEFSYFLEKYAEKERIYNFMDKDVHDVRKWENYIKLCKDTMELCTEHRKNLLEIKINKPSYRLNKISYDNINTNEYQDYHFSNSTKHQEKIKQEIKEWLNARNRIRRFPPKANT